MKRSRNDKSQTGALTEKGMFKNKKPLKEEVLMLMVMHEEFYERIRKATQTALGDNFTEAAAEKNYAKFVEECREKGYMKELLDSYLQKKIAYEREKYASPRK